MYPGYWLKIQIIIPTKNEKYLKIEYKYKTKYELILETKFPKLIFQLKMSINILTYFYQIYYSNQNRMQHNFE